MRLLLTLVILCLATSTAQAYWAIQNVWVQQTYQVQVLPAPVLSTCSLGYGHVVQPAPYWQQQTRWVLQPQYVWVPDPVMIVDPIVYPSTPCYHGTSPYTVYPW